MFSFIVKYLVSFSYIWIKEKNALAVFIRSDPKESTSADKIYNNLHCITYTVHSTCTYFISYMTLSWMLYHWDIHYRCLIDYESNIKPLIIIIFIVGDDSTFNYCCIKWHVIQFIYGVMCNIVTDSVSVI